MTPVINLNSPWVLAGRDAVYTAGGLVSRLLGLHHPVTILCYHSVSDDGWRFSTPPAEFKKHLGLLLANFRFITLDTAAAYVEGTKFISRPSVVLTFDDGYADLLDLRAQLTGLGIKPAVFALADPGSADRVQLNTDKPLLNASGLAALKKAGWTIGCHSATHPDFSRLSPSAVRREIILAKTRLESAVCAKVNYFAYPKGFYNPEIVAAVKSAGYRLALSMDNRQVSPKSSPFAVPRVGIDASHNLARLRDSVSPVNIYLRKKLSRFPVSI